MTNTTKLRINAEGMRQIDDLANDLLKVLWDRIPDISIDQCQTDIAVEEDKALDEDSALERLILDMLCTTLKREF